jgi:large subunit ribosomal protein L22
MSKPSNSRRQADNEAKAVLRTIRVSPRKLDLVAATIRGKKAASAVNELTFSKKRIAQDVKKALNSAIANAENNHNLDVDRLIVAEASVGKGLVMKRFQTRGRGRAAGIIKPFFLGVVIVTIGCHVGLRTTGGTQGVGRATTNAVVAASVVVLVVDFFVTRLLISILF